MGLRSNRIALVSGANRGIGSAVARRLFEAGWSVSLGMRKPAQPDWASHDHERVQTVVYEATDPDAGRHWAAQAMDRFGRIDAVVANAGISIPKTVIEIDDTEMAHLLDVNVQGPRRLAVGCWEALSASGCGRVILLASLSGQRVKTARSGAYAVSKFAVVGLAHAMRHTGFEAGIRATAVCPGFVATDMALGLSNRAAEAMTAPEDLARVIEMLIDLPNTASVAEFCINCQLEDSF